MPTRLRYLLLGLAGLQILIPILPGLVPGLQAIGADYETSLHRPPEVPPGVFFSIWGAIFATYLGVAIVAVRDPHSPVSHIAVPLAWAGGLGCAWMVLEQLNTPIGLTYPVLVGLAAVAWWAAARFDQYRTAFKSYTKHLADAASGLLAGWMTVATALGSVQMIRAIFDYGPTDATWPIVASLLGLLSLGAWLAFKRVTKSLFFVAALAWGLLGVVINLWFFTGLNVPAVLTACVGLLILRGRFRIGKQTAATMHSTT